MVIILFLGHSVFALTTAKYDDNNNSRKVWRKHSFVRKMLATSLLLVGLLGGALSGALSGIPTKQEQADVLGSVQEVFEQVKRMVDEEGKTTDVSVIEDMRRMAKRAQDALAMMEELALIKITCLKNENSVQSEKLAKQAIQKTIQEGYEHLELCTQKVSKEIHSSSEQVFDVASAATSRGQELLNALAECTTKSVLQQINCYRLLMRTEVFPVKVMLLEAIGAHQLGHSESIEIRGKANACVDEVLGLYQAKVANILGRAIQ